MQEDDYEFQEEYENESDINAWQIHITKPLTSETIIELMDKYPSLRRITCSKSLYDRIPSKYIEALNSLDIIVEIDYDWGRKQVYSNEDINQVLNLLNDGKSPKIVSQELEIPLKRVYYFRNKYSQNPKKNYHKRKYDEENRIEIKKLKDEGFNPKEISEKFNIPIRSIYYILNNK
jgi:hypothetical protein